MAKKFAFDVCGGSCESCEKFAAKDFSCQLILLKRKVVTKFVPPDMGAIKMVVDAQEKKQDLDSMTMDQLKALEKELLDDLKKDD